MLLHLFLVQCGSILYDLSIFDLLVFFTVYKYERTPGIGTSYLIEIMHRSGKTHKFEMLHFQSPFPTAYARSNEPQSKGND